MYAKTATYAEIFAEHSTFLKAFYNVLLVGGGCFAIALSAQAYLPLGFTPVPVTLQTLTVLLAGALLGSRKGAFAVLTYLGLGIAGLPFFAQGGVGFARFMGPTGGYLAGFVAAAYVVGLFFERGWGRNVFKTAAALLAGSAIIYLFGLARLAIFVGWERVLPLGLYPFIIGDLVKLITAVLTLSAGRLFANRKL